MAMMAILLSEPLSCSIIIIKLAAKNVVDKQHVPLHSDQQNIHSAQGCVEGAMVAEPRTNRHMRLNYLTLSLSLSLNDLCDWCDSDKQ